MLKHNPTKSEENCRYLNITYLTFLTRKVDGKWVKQNFALILLLLLYGVDQSPCFFTGALYRSTFPMRFQHCAFFTHFFLDIVNLDLETVAWCACWSDRGKEKNSTENIFTRHMDYVIKQINLHHYYLVFFTPNPNLT